MDSDIPLIVIGVGLIVMGFCVTPLTLQFLFGIAGGLCIALGCEDHYEL